MLAGAVICIVPEGFGATAGDESDAAAVGLGIVFIWRPKTLGLIVCVFMPTIVSVGVEIERLETIPVAGRVVSRGWDLGDEGPPTLNIL
jgi:hypothetical protein